MKKGKLIELRIDEEDLISGIDRISLVESPAINIEWIAFDKQKLDYFSIPDGEDEKYLMKLVEYGQSEEELLENGYTIHSVGNFEVEKFFETYPNAESEWNTDEYLVRYKYVLNPEASGQKPIEKKTRQFCKTLINKNMVFRIEDMDRLTNDEGDPALVWRGGYNCRHSWSKILYKKDTKIVNKASINKGKVLGEGGVFPTDMEPELGVLGYGQPDTRTSHPSFSKEDEFDYVNNLPSYKDDIPTGKTEFDSYTDYPEGATSNAKRALEWVDKHGWGSCGEATGKQRANQLANREPISRDTIARMAAFKRHQQHKDVPYSEGCGGLMWDAWGGDAGINWASRKLEEIDKENMSKQSFKFDDEQRIVIGPAMIPNLKILRKDKNGDPYYVFFTSETIKTIAEKYMRNKYLDNNDTDHNEQTAKDVYVFESWIKEDVEDKSNKYGFGDLPIGTWFVSMRVKNDKIWKRIKNRELNGYSVSGFFEEVEQFQREEQFLKELVEILKKS